MNSPRWEPQHFSLTPGSSGFRGRQLGWAQNSFCAHPPSRKTLSINDLWPFFRPGVHNSRGISTSYSPILRLRISRRSSPQHLALLELRRLLLLELLSLRQMVGSARSIPKTCQQPLRRRVSHGRTSLSGLLTATHLVRYSISNRYLLSSVLLRMK